MQPAISNGVLVGADTLDQRGHGLQSSSPSAERKRRRRDRAQSPTDGDFALSTSERIAFGAGSLATGTYAVVPGLVLLYYLTDVLGVTAALASFVVFLPKMLDLVYNPIIGRLSDSTVSRVGPRRPWMIAGMILFPFRFRLDLHVAVRQAQPGGSAERWH